MFESGYLKRYLRQFIVDISREIEKATFYCLSPTETLDETILERCSEANEIQLLRAVQDAIMQGNSIWFEVSSCHEKRRNFNRTA